MEYLYTKNGRPLRLQGDDLFSASGAHVGRIKGGRVFDSQGKYVGTVVRDRVVYNSLHSASSSSPFYSRPSAGFIHMDKLESPTMGEEPPLAD